MRAREMRSVFKAMRRQERHRENPYATQAAAETLEQNGYVREAMAVRAEAGHAVEDISAMDPMELLILAEELAEIY